MINSTSLKRLNVVKIYYEGKDETGKDGTHYVFDSKSAPLYYIGEDLPSIKLSADIDSGNVWGTSKSFGGNLGRSVLQGITSKIDALQGFSGVIDLRSKFAYNGSSTLDFTVPCMLVNTSGWDKSIAPTLNKIVNWLLPDHWKDADGKDYVIGQGFMSTAHAQAKDVGKDMKNENWGKTYNSLYSLLLQGLDAVQGWIGEAKLLSIPEEFSLLENAANKAHLYIGPQDGTSRFNIPDVFITGADISIPKTYMINSKGEPEPDCVKITFSVKTIRQTTKSMIKF